MRLLDLRGDFAAESRSMRARVRVTGG